MRNSLVGALLTIGLMVSFSGGIVAGMAAIETGHILYGAVFAVLMALTLAGAVAGLVALARNPDD